MGSMIYLALGRLEVDWGKNSGFVSHNALFQPGDRKPVPYYYAEDVVEFKDGLSRPLRDVLRRLDLLGYTENMLAKSSASSQASTRSTRTNSRSTNLPPRSPASM